jgi:hypothetical protein
MDINLKPSPIISFYNAINCRTANAELTPKTRHFPIFSGVPGSNLFNVGFAKFAIWMFFAKMNWRLSSLMGAPLFCAVLRVIFIRTKKKMAGPNARRIIALVTNKKAAGDRAIMHFPRGAVCANRFPVKAKASVPLFISKRNPLPAAFRFLNFFPESFHARIDSVLAAVCQ